MCIDYSYLGAASSGTLRNSDLLDKLGGLADTICEDGQGNEKLRKLADEAWNYLENYTADEINYSKEIVHDTNLLVQNLVEALNEVAPPDCYWYAARGRGNLWLLYTRVCK